MTYRVFVDSETRDIFQSSGDEIKQIIREEVAKLADDPAIAGRPAVFPFVPIGYVYEFTRRIGDRKNYFTIFYTYDPNKEELYLSGFLQRN